MRRARPVAEAIPLAKLRPPDLPSGHVARHALAARLAEAWRHPVTLVSAPAGFGKTSAVVAALHAGGFGRSAEASAAPGHLAWVSLDEHDAEPQRFFRLIGAALERATGMGGELVAALEGPQPPAVRTLLTPLLNALDRADARALLCVDDLHLVEDERVHDDLAYVVEHAPPGLRLLLASRADPPLPLHRWRARGQLLEVRADDLRLNVDETSAVIEGTLGRPLEPGAAAVVHRATEGWAVGVRLASLALRGADERDEHALLAHLDVGEGFALEYLAEEVLARLPAPLTAFVLDAAALDAFTPDLLDAVRGTGDARAHLEHARAAGLFVEPAAAPAASGGGTGEGPWWRFHRLFRSLLRGHARAAAPERERDVQRRAADWFAARGATATAVAYASTAADDDRTTRLLEASAYALVMDGHARLVERTLEGLSDEARRRAPHARLAHGWALLLRGRYADLAEVLSDLSDAGDAFGIAARAQLTTLRAVLAGIRGHAHEAMVLATEALAAAPVGDAVTRAAAQMALAGAHRERGDLGAAIAAYEAALPTCRAARLAVPEGLARAHLGLLYAQRGRLGRALSVTRPLEGFEGHPAAAAALASRCAVLLEQDRRDDARRALPGVAALAQRAGQPAVVANVHLVWSRLHRADGDDPRARDALEAAQAAAAEGVPTWLRALVSIRAGEASLADGDPDAAAAHLDAAAALDPRGPAASELALGRARAHLQRGTADDVASALALLRSLADAEGGDDVGDGVRIAARVLESVAQAAAGDEHGARTTLARAVRAAEPEGYVRTFVDAGPACAALLATIGHPYAVRLRTAFAPDARHPAARAATDDGADALTDRERDVLRELASARTYERIAETLGVSVNTVRFHVKHVYAKLGVRTRMEAVERARGWGLVEGAQDVRGDPPNR